MGEEITNMKEIGGYFELENPGGREYHEELIALNTSRNALLYLMRAKRIEKLYIPYYMCDSVEDLCRRNRIDYAYYHINADFTPDFSLACKRNEALYLVNYFGQLPEEIIAVWKERYPTCILDNAHAFFDRPFNGIDTIYSCRKFFGVPDGAYLSTDCRLSDELPADTSGARVSHLVGRLENGASQHYPEFVQNEQSFAGHPLLGMSAITHRLLRAIDYDGARRHREENFLALHSALSKTNALSPRKSAGPFCYPYYCEQGAEVRKRLAANKIYVPTLWPEVLQYEGTREADYTANILPLPCDQRYTVSDMEYMLERLEEARK